MKVIVEHLSFCYGDHRPALKDVSFQLKAGQTLAIAGASGCGKSTLLRIISGILPVGKEQSLNGKVSIDNCAPELYRRSEKLAFMFQDATLMPNLTVRQNIELPLSIRKDCQKRSVDALLDAVGLSEYEGFLPKQLSGGMKTRVALARSFSTGPELLLLDEPFSALDIAWKRRLYIELENLREEFGTTVIMVTHDVQEALLLANQVLVIDRCGQVAASHHIATDWTIPQRVSNITGFMSEVYTSYMLPIQDAIVNEKNRQDEKVDHLFGL